MILLFTCRKRGILEKHPKDDPNATYVMLYRLVITLDRCETIILHVVNPNQANPLVSSLDDRLAQLGLISVILNREGIQRINLGCPLEILEQNRSLHSADPNGMANGAINQIDTLAHKMVRGLSVDCGPRE